MSVVSIDIEHLQGNSSTGMLDAQRGYMFQAGSVTLFHVRGVPVRAHWTLLLIVPYLALVLSAQFEPVTELADIPQEMRLVLPLIWGLVLALALFASITLHELAHSIVAIRFGGHVHSITLMILGGVSQFSRLPRRPYQEMLIAAAGPATSLTLGGLLYAAYMACRGAPPDFLLALFYLAAMNLTLGLFNLLPAFPMDGGRVLRALLAFRLSPERATQIAGATGKAFALVLGGLGVWAGNLLLVLVAVMVYSGARSEILQERLHAGLEGLRAIDLLPRARGPAPFIVATQSLGDALRRMRDLDRLMLVVVDALGTPLTVLEADDLAHAAVDARGSTTLGDLSARLPARHIVVSRDVNASDALARAAEAGVEYMVVTDPGAERPSQLVGLVTAEDIARMSKLKAITKQMGPRSAAASFAA